MKWLYKENLESGILIELEDEAKYKELGYVDSPDDYVAESTDLEQMTKKDLEIYAKKMFGVDIDRRRNNKQLVKQIKALEAGLL